MGNDMLKEQSPMGRFEIMCETYLSGTEEIRDIIMENIPTSDREAFLTGCGLYHLFTDETFFRAVCEAMAEQFWNDTHSSTP